MAAGANGAMHAGREQSASFRPWGRCIAGTRRWCERCRDENELVVVSIFVNPTQFNDPKDLDRYPRVIGSDLALLESLGVGRSPRPCRPGPLSGRDMASNRGWRPDGLDGGRIRPGFLQGVMTIVLKLLNLVRARSRLFRREGLSATPDRHLEMASEDFFIPTEIVACPTVRAESGLAESSRGTGLSAEDRARKPRACMAHTLVTAPHGRRSEIAILDAEGLTVDYVEEHWGRRLPRRFSGWRAADRQRADTGEGD
jgi:pantoate--beta-alanine ligase